MPEDEKLPAILSRIAEVDSKIEGLFKILSPVICEQRAVPGGAKEKPESLVMERLNNLSQKLDALAALIDIQN